MPSATSQSKYTHQALDQSATWSFRDSIRLDDFHRYCKANKAVTLVRDDEELSFCALVSAKCSHVAFIEAVPAKKTITVSVYGLNNGFQKEWSVNYHGTEDQFEQSKYSTIHDTHEMHGGITEDGAAVLLIHSPAGAVTTAYLVNANGFTARSPPADTGTRYLESPGLLSEDSENLFYTVSGEAFGRNGEAKVVEAYSIRHCARVLATSFGFGDGRNMRNAQLLSPLRTTGPIYVAIETSSFGGSMGARDSPMLIASSNLELHNNFSQISTIDTGGSPGKRVFISGDGAHMVSIGRDTAMLHHWDLKHPTLNPLGSIKLPGLQYSQPKRWFIYGKETTVSDAIPEQSHFVRFSPACKVVTIITASQNTIAVNVLQTFNLQLISHEVLKDAKWADMIPIHCGFSESTEFNFLYMAHSGASKAADQTVDLLGISCTLTSIPELFKKVRRIEDYFDSTPTAIKDLIDAVSRKTANPVSQFRWKPGVMKRNDQEAIQRERGDITQSALYQTSQKRLFEQVFTNKKGGWGVPSTADNQEFFVPHLFRFSYPWDAAEHVDIFGIIMENEYHILSVGPSPIPGQPDVLRALYATDIKTSVDELEHVEIYKQGLGFFLRVYKRNESMGSYSGAPMPIPRWTLLSPHFLEDDAWYDVFVLHRAKHVTMPGGWSITPNVALSYTANFYAYMEPNTVALQDSRAHGHRTRSVYAFPKYHFWMDYGLRGLRDPTTTDVFFGGGQYTDRIGSYFRSIYDDPTHDDAYPLFPSVFALVCNGCIRTQKTMHVDAFFRRLHQDPGRILENSQAISYALAIACRARPLAALSLMRHLVEYPFIVNDIGAVEVKVGRTKRRRPYSSRPEFYGWRYWVENVWAELKYLFRSYWQNTEDNEDLEPNTSHLTLPLAGFCSFRNRIYRPVPGPRGGRSFDSPEWEFCNAVYPHSDYYSRGSWLLNWVAKSGRQTASPFTRLVEEILDMDKQDVKLSFLKVVWLEELLTWKMQTFGTRIYVSRMAVPMIALFCVHLAIAVLWTNDRNHKANGALALLIVLATTEALISAFILSVKMRQLYRIPRLFFRSIFNYIDFTALSLGLTLFSLVVSGTTPPRTFLAFSTLMIWTATILLLRIYQPVGMLLLLLTEALQGVFLFLVLLFMMILGFAFVPFLLLRNLEVAESEHNPFSSFSSTIFQVLNFVSSDYGALEPFQTSSAGVRTLRSLYIIVITILFLNTLIALLNLKIKKADQSAANLYFLQTASLQVEIELGLLSSAERARRDWFPEWFSYTMTETEKQVWRDYVKRHPLKWTQENDFGEEKDNVKPPPPAATKTQQETAVDSLTNNNGVFSSAASTTAGTETERPLSTQTEAPTNGQAPARFDNMQPPTASASTTQTVDVNQSTASSTAASSAIIANDRAPVASQESSNVIHTCKICGKAGSLCKGCSAVAYCGKEHQSADWPLHKAECKRLREGRS